MVDLITGLVNISNTYVGVFTTLEGNNESLNR